jgi:hypothetical protein
MINRVDEIVNFCNFAAHHDTDGAGGQFLRMSFLVKVMCGNAPPQNSCAAKKI